MASAVSTKKHSTLALAVVVSLLAMLGLVVLPAQTASASVTPGTVSPNVGAASGGLSTTITLATNGGMASSANGVVFLGVDKNLYRVKDGVQLNAGGVSFVSASGFIARDYTVHIMGVGNDGNAYVAIGTTTTMTKVNLANAGITALATYGGMVILGSDKKLYWDGGTAIGGDFTSASTTISAANSYLVNAIGTDSAGYWNATGGAFGKVNG
ncbi:hypothetical protein, partial [Mesorhizobium japonicum]|uniref:hypothetical protein n=1 Tax=Mesorhizobium japonicum TaxID=2066070 RepID=UPI003B5CB497